MDQNGISDADLKLRFEVLKNKIPKDMLEYLEIYSLVKEQLSGKAEKKATNKSIMQAILFLSRRNEIYKDFSEKTR